ncbi:MAG: nucleotidyltransferase family protein, partial [Bdellovibrio sp. CG_4_9_14_3_um_filter_39_7]
MSINTGLILCAGKGTRMGAIGKVLPKPLWPLFEKTLIDWQIIQMMKLGIKNIYINT